MTDSQTDLAVQKALQELSRQKRLVDQSLTMQARLRDRDQVTGTVLLCTVLTALLVGVAFAFAGSGPSLTLIGLAAARATWLGWLAVGTAVLTFVELIIDKRGAAQRRESAVKILAPLKAAYRVPPAAGAEVAEALRMGERYGQAMETVPPVPERSFNRLKAAHLRKVEISKLLSDNPGMSYRRARRSIVKRSPRARPDPPPQANLPGAQAGRAP